MDADGCYWICGNDAGFVHRFTPTANSTVARRSVKSRPCARLVGKTDTLFVTSIRPGGVDLSDQPLAGGVSPCGRCSWLRIKFRLA